MRSIPPGMADAIAAGASSLCQCWRLTRADGMVLGFTDHDADIAFEGTSFRADSGLAGGDVETTLGLAVGGTEVSGALTSAALTETDIALGLWDNATVERWRVDWRDPSQRLLLDRGSIGEIRRHDHGFTVEVRSPAHVLDQPRGRLFQANCAADLGDARCGVNVDVPAYRGAGAVNAPDSRQSFDVSGLEVFADGWFTGGWLVWTSGANAGGRAALRRHAASGSLATLSLFQPTVRPIVAGDAFLAYAGCDKRFDTCRTRFANQLNFRGFPHMPGNDFVLSYARSGEPGLDGGSTVR